MALKHRRGTIGAHGHAVLRSKVYAEWDRLLVGRYTDLDNLRLAKLLRNQRASVPGFLDHDAVEATDKRAEQDVRQAVIAQKLSAGNGTEVGAETYTVLASPVRTNRHQVRKILEGLMALLRHGPSHLLKFHHIASLFSAH